MSIQTVRELLRCNRWANDRIARPAAGQSAGLSAGGKQFVAILGRRRFAGGLHEWVKESGTDHIECVAKAAEKRGTA
ncbi:MAG: hypothetical protein ABII12_00430 [Planctomycetota bacterium]